MEYHPLTNWIENLDPNGDPPNLHSEFDDSHRDDVIDVIETFCRHLNTRLTMFARHGPGAIEIFDTDADLQSKHIGQEPHTFLRDFLIAPIMDVLGYAFLSEPRPAQAEPHIWSDHVYPDLRLIPRHWPSDEINPTIIVEFKKIGRYKYAKKELTDDYLSNAHGPVYGIATDVCNWGCFHVAADGEPEELNRVQIRRLLQKIRRDVTSDAYEREIFPHEIDPFINLFKSLPGNVRPSEN